MNYARIAARHFGADGREYYVTPQDVAETLPRVAATFDEPFGNSSAVPTFLCARFAQTSGITRLLAGDGGDEIFGGNERYAKQKVFDLYTRVPAALRTGLLEPWALRGTSLNALWPARKLRSYVQQASIPMPERLQTWNFMYRTGAAAMFDAGFLRQVDPRDPFRLMSATYDEAPTDALVDRMLYFDWKFTLADNDLRKVGRMCELAGVQVSYPMLDDRVLDVSLRVPPEQKVRRFELRHFYKETMKDFLPHEIITKSKHGFGLPFGQWLKATPALQAEVYPAVEALKKRDIVRSDFIDNTLREFQTDPDASYFGPMIWVLAILEHWLQARRL
jgi:asparagine synthase (glutamine-hydrolysing)